MHITPSAVSQQIKKLEMEIGTLLFTRLHKRLVPTPAGKRLYRLTAHLIDSLQDGMEVFNEGRNEPSGILRMGSPVEFGSIYLPHVISTYRNRYPKVSFDLELGRPSDLVPKVESGDLDFALVDTFPTKGQSASSTGILPAPIRSQRDNLRRNRDLLYFGLVFWYGLSVLDAVVSAHLMDFDVGEDLTVALYPEPVTSGLTATVRWGF